jgi:hypothetical protein
MSLETQPHTNGDPLPPLRPHQRHQQMEADAFCETCGYNLHGQPVARDERLGLMLCRCPECGRYHAAGKATTAASLWLSRLAAALMGVWIVIVLFAIFWIGMGFGALQVAHVEALSYVHRVADADGREVEWNQTSSGGSQMVYTGTTQPVLHWHNARTLQMPREWERPPEWQRAFLAWLVVGDVALGFLTGALLVTFFWHWRRWRYLLVMLLPVGVAAVALWGTLVASEGEYDPIAHWAASRILCHAAAQAAGILAGILVGRIIARTLVRMFIPPRPRQHLAFLWLADGKPSPAARTAAGAQAT